MPAGRPRKPTALKKLEGDQPCRINRKEPQPPAGGVGNPPADLDERASACWIRLVKILDAMGLVTSADADALAFYCRNYSVYLRAHEDLDREGLTVSTQHSFKPHPMLAVAANAEKQMARFLTQFGLTPAARAALGKAPDDGDDEFIRYLKESHASKRETRKKQAGPEN